MLEGPNISTILQIAIIWSYNIAVFGGDVQYC